MQDSKNDPQTLETGEKSSYEEKGEIRYKDYTK